MFSVYDENICLSCFRCVMRIDEVTARFLVYHRFISSFSSVSLFSSYCCFFYVVFRHVLGKLYILTVVFFYAVIRQALGKLYILTSVLWFQGMLSIIHLSLMLCFRFSYLNVVFQIFILWCGVSDFLYFDVVFLISYFNVAFKIVILWCGVFISNVLCLLLLLHIKEMNKLDILECDLGVWIPASPSTSRHWIQTSPPTSHPWIPASPPTSHPKSQLLL